MNALLLLSLTLAPGGGCGAYHAPSYVQSYAPPVIYSPPTIIQTVFYPIFTVGAVFTGPQVAQPLITPNPLAPVAVGKAVAPAPAGGPVPLASPAGPPPLSICEQRAAAAEARVLKLESRLDAFLAGGPPIVKEGNPPTSEPRMSTEGSERVKPPATVKKVEQPKEPARAIKTPRSALIANCASCHESKQASIAVEGKPGKSKGGSFVLLTLNDGAKEGSLLEGDYVYAELSYKEQSAFYKKVLGRMMPPPPAKLDDEDRSLLIEYVAEKGWLAKESPPAGK